MVIITYYAQEINKIEKTWCIIFEENILYPVNYELAFTLGSNSYAAIKWHVELALFEVR